MGTFEVRKGSLLYYVWDRWKGKVINYYDNAEDAEKECHFLNSLITSEEITDEK